MLSANNIEFEKKILINNIFFLKVGQQFSKQNTISLSSTLVFGCLIQFSIPLQNNQSELYVYSCTNMHNKHAFSSLGTHKNNQDINLNYNGQKSLEFGYTQQVKQG